MDKAQPQKDKKGILVISLVAGFIASLCCVTPVVIVLLGLATVAAANSLGNKLYGEWAWAFRIIALLFLAFALVIYFRGRGVCTLDQAKRQRNRIINISVLALTVTIVVYLIGTYVSVHYWGIAAGLPWAQYSDEKWAIPAAIVVLAAGGITAWLLRRRPHSAP